jgi:hypothetical protein
MLITAQILLDMGINVWSLQLLLESFIEVMGTETKPLEFTYNGVKVSLQIDKETPS